MSIAETAGTISTPELLEIARRSPTTDLPTASRAFGFGANLGYELAARGEFPCRVLRLGRKLRVPTADLLRALGISSDSDDVHAPRPHAGIGAA